MNAPAALYRNLVPAWIRSPLWRLRTFGWKSAVARAHVALGQPVVRARSGGADLYVDLRDAGVGQYLYFGGAFEPSETQFIRRRLSAGMTMIDVGANLGYHTTHAARCVGPTGRVLAIEPDPYNYSLLERNVRSNALGNVQTCNVALGATPGRATLYRSAGNLGDHRLFATAGDGRLGVEVPVVRLDDLCRDQGLGRVNLIKMDVQGYEPFVLEGMRQTVVAHADIVVVTEFWPYGMEAAGSSAEKFFRTLEACGLQARILEDGRPTSPVDLDGAIQALPPFDERHPDYCGLTLVLSQGPLSGTD